MYYALVLAASRRRIDASHTGRSDASMHHNISFLQSQGNALNDIVGLLLLGDMSGSTIGLGV
jgi:hypothetical protein